MADNKEMKTLAFGDVTYEIVDEKARKRYDSEGENSFATNDTAVALGGYSFASGKDTVAGCKGYYIKSIDLENKKIYLCNEKVLPVISEDDNTDASFETPAYEVGDLFNIINDYHYMLCASITSVSNNVISYEGNLGFTEIVEDSGEDGYTFSIPSKPSVGVVNITYGCFVDGENNSAIGRSSFVSGRNNMAVGYYGHVEGRDNITGYSSHAEGYFNKALSIACHAEGGNNEVNGDLSHVEGTGNQANGNVSHAEGKSNIIEGYSSHAEGEENLVKGNISHAEGYDNVINNCNYSHVEGVYNEINSNVAHVEGQKNTAIGSIVHAEGGANIAKGDISHVEGNNNQANGNISHAEGTGNIANGHISHVEGKNNIAKGYCSHVEGKFNVEDIEEKYAHIVGNGNSDESRSNAHTLDWQGNAWYKGSVTMNGADYAEYFEWSDGNPNNEDRVGLLVTLDGEKIKLANTGDEIIGIISGTAAVLGDNYECEWNGKYLTDDFGRVIYDLVEEFIDVEHIEFKEVEKEIIDEETNETRIEIELEEVKTTEKKSLGFWKQPRLNPDYNSEQKYINRSDRPEWDTVGMLGKLYVKDDGTCEVNGYATVGENGIATASSEKTNMRVLSRVNENVVRVLLK